MFQFPNRTQSKQLPEQSDASFKKHTLRGRVGADEFDSLPAHIATKRNQLHDLSLDLSAWASTPYHRLQELLSDKRESERRLIELERNYRPCENDRLLEAERSSHQTLINEISRLSTIHNERRPRADATRRLVESVDRYLRQAGNDLKPFSVTCPAIPKNSTFETEVEKKREQIKLLREDIESAQDAPVHASTTKKIARDFVLKLASRGAIDVAPTLESGLEPELPLITSSIISPPGSDNTDCIGLIFWALQDQIITRLEKSVDEIADDKSALTPDQRITRIEEAKGKILSLEREEAAVIEKAAIDGVIIDWRPDIDPRAVLAVAGPAPRPDH